VGGYISVAIRAKWGIYDKVRLSIVDARERRRETRNI
jgi:hypothetical protein